MFRCVSYYLGAFGTVCCVTILSSKTAKLVQKFVPQSRVGIFHNERTRSIPWDYKLMFWCVMYYLDAFGTIWLSYKTQCKTGRTGANVSEVFPTNAPDPPYWTLTSCFVAFHTIWEHLGQFVALQHSVQNRPNLCKSSCHEVASEFFAKNAPNPPHWTLN